MKHAQFISQIDESRILAAITEAESKTTGLIRVLVSRRECEDPLAAAHEHFKALKLDKTPEHNAVLIFVAPKSHTFAIYGDTLIHARGGQSFWNAIRDEMAKHLKDSRFTDALLHAIKQAGQLLAEHFPRSVANPPA
jgi:uncharacterized membrane protein